VISAILVLHETQRLVDIGKTRHRVLRRESEMRFCAPIDPGGQMVTPGLAFNYLTPSPYF
jgi:hypothetical protein